MSNPYNMKLNIEDGLVYMLPHGSELLQFQDGRAVYSTGDAVDSTEWIAKWAPGSYCPMDHD